MIASFNRFVTVASALALSSCLALLSVSACSRQTVEQPVAYVIADASVPAFDLASVGASIEYFAWTFAEADSLADWELVNADRSGRIEDGALIIESSGDDPQMSRSVDLDAAAVRALEFRVRADEGDNLKVYWARAGEVFSETRALVAGPRTTTAVDGEFRTVTLPVGDHFDWRGRIRHLRVDPTHIPGERVHLVEVRALGLSARADRVAEVVGAARRVGLLGDHRVALLTAIDAPVERTVSAPDGGILRFGYGVKCLRPGAPPRLRFEIHAATPAGGAEPIFSREIAVASDAGDAPYGGWQEGEADVPAHDDVSLTFRVVSPSAPTDASDPQAPGGAGPGVPCMAAWANPVVVAPTSAPAPPNVVLISIDTLRSDRLSRYGRRSGLTPQIDDWSRRRAVTFPNAIAAAPWTLPSHTSMLTGLDALSHGVNHDLPAPAHLSLLAERLRAAAYSTVAFTGGGYLDPRFGLDQGFDRYASWTEDLAGDAELATNVDRFLHWLGNATTRPFFAFLHTYEVHAPYRRRQPYFDDLYEGEAGDLAGESVSVRDGRLGAALIAANRDPDTSVSPEIVDLVNAMYDSGVAYADAQLGRVFAELERLELADDTIVILTSDHGEALGENGAFGHDRLQNETIVVPLVIAVPGLGDGGVRHDRVRSIDIVPTLLELLGLPFDGLDGESLVPLLEGEPRSVGRVWSFSSQRGIAVRSADDIEYVFHPASWRAAGDREEFYALVDGSPETRAARPRDERDAELRQQAVARLEAMPGLDVRFENEGDRSYSVTLRRANKALEVARVMTPRLPLPCECLRWNRDRSLSLTVPAGISYGIRLTGLRPLALIFEGSIGDRGFAAELRPDDIDAPRSLSIGAPEAGFVGGPLLGGAGITVSRTGPLPGAEGVVASPDPDLLRQLRALGYLR